MSITAIFQSIVLIAMPYLTNVNTLQIWNHPDILHKLLVQKKIDEAEDNDLDIDNGGETGAKKKPGAKKSKAAEKRADQVISYEWVGTCLNKFVL